MKKKNVTRFFAVMLSLAVSLSAVACGKDNQGNPSKDKEQEVSQEQENLQEQESAYPAYLNLDGYRPLVQEGEEITLTMAVKRDGGATKEIEDMWIYSYFKDVLNVNLEVVTYTDETVSEQKSLMLASGELPDIMISLPF